MKMDFWTLLIKMIIISIIEWILDFVNKMTRDLYDEMSFWTLLIKEVIISIMKLGIRRLGIRRWVSDVRYQTL